MAGQRLQEHTQADLLLDTIVSAALLWGLVHILGWSPGFHDWVIVDPKLLTTLLQVVPATVVAVFVFAAGAIFVVAQVIHSPLGSRGVEELLLSKRVFTALVTGVLLLFSSLALVVVARLTGSSEQPELDDAVASAASALALATAFYALAAISGIVVVLSDFVRPERYMQRLVPREARGDSAPLDPEEVYRRLRAIRQWLRISCGSGESRDLTFALLGIQRLVDAYIKMAGPEATAEREKIRSARPAEYTAVADIVRMHWRNGGMAEEPSKRPDWFGDELGRAFARSLETGILSGSLLVRDADRLLGLMCWAVARFSAVGLRDEAGSVLDRIGEIGLFGRMAPGSPMRDWCFQASSCALLGFASETLVARDPPEQVPTDRALAAWILVANEELRRRADEAKAIWPPADADDWRTRLELAGLSAELDKAYSSADATRRRRVPCSTNVDALVKQLVEEVSWTEAGRADAAPQDGLRTLTGLVVADACSARSVTCHCPCHQP